MKPIIIAAALLYAGTATAKTVHVHAGRVIDPERAQVLLDQRIDVVDGKVAALVPWSDPKDGAEVVD